MTSRFRVRGPAIVAALCILPPTAALATPSETPAVDEVGAVHAQVTVLDQGTFAFRSPYRGPNSLDPAARGRETADVTLYAGLRVWKGAELWANPEFDQGFGLSNTLGAAGFPSGEAYKVGKETPYLKLPRLFVRQTFDLGGERATVQPDLNQLGGSHTTDRLVITVGKFGVPDVFDANAYSHDPRNDFLNWSLIDTGSFDYAADAWGFTYGAALEWYEGRWTARAGVFNLSVVPNSPTLGSDFSQNQTVLEVEERHDWGGWPGVLRLTGYLSHGRMGSFDDAVRQAAASGGIADIAAVRRVQDRAGLSLSLEQALSDDLGLFGRAGVTDGSKESYEFSDIDRTAAAGLSLKGAHWGRPDDVVAVGVVVNGISKAHQRFLNAGGLGILVGDGRLPNPGAEAILETYYDVAAAKGLHLSLDYQLIDHPAYNRDRGPVSVVAARLHGQF